MIDNENPPREDAAMNPEPAPQGPDNPFVGIDARTGVYARSRARAGRRCRVKGAANAESHCYHVMSRTCGGTALFDDVEKEALLRLMRRMSGFLGMRVLTYCVMSNHFHILVEVPHKDLWLERLMERGGEDALLRHLAKFYSRSFMHELRTDLKQLRDLGQEAYAQERLAVFTRRFCDLSIWCKEIKERFGRWYNRRHGRKGTLWMERFKSVLVQDGEALKTMAAYIDLNPVRAQLVEEPEDYRWCGYAEALSGDKEARQGLCRVMGAAEACWSKPVAAGYGSVAELYRMGLFGNGVVRMNRGGQVSKKGFSERTSREVIKGREGRLSTAELIRHRVRHFTQGLALGSREWVEQVFVENRDSFGPKRKTGARHLRDAEAGLFALRDLKGGD